MAFLQQIEKQLPIMAVGNDIPIGWPATRFITWYAAPGYSIRMGRDIVATLRKIMVDSQ